MLKNGNKSKQKRSKRTLKQRKAGSLLLGQGAWPPGVLIDRLLYKFVSETKGRL
jgi:hypothetical protein